MMDTGIFDALEEEDLLLIAAVLHRKKTPTNQNKMGARNLIEIWGISLASPGAETECNKAPKLFSCVLKFLADILCLLGYHIYILTTYIFEE